MSNWDMSRTRLLHYILEGNIVLLVIFGYMIHRSPEVVWGFLFLYLMGGILYLLFIQIKKTMTIGSLVIFSPVIILIGMIILNLSFMLTLVITSYIIYRILGHFQEIDYQNELLLFTISLVIGLVIYSFFESKIEGRYIFLILFVQLLLTIFIKFNRVYLDMKLQNGFASKKFAIWSFSSTGVILGLGLFFLFLFPYIQATIFFIFKSAISIIAYVVMYPINLLLAYFDPSIDPKKLEFLQGGNGEESQEDMKAEVVDGVSIDPISLYIIGVVILVIVIAFFFFKKLDLKAYIKPAYVVQGQSLENDKNETWNMEKKKYPVPENTIRKRFYTFEHLMKKYELGRKQHESVSEWLKRLKLKDDQIENVKKLYEKVRYGDMDLNKEEEKYYIKLMDDLSEASKALYKEEKKKRKSEKKEKQSNGNAKNR